MKIYFATKNAGKVQSLQRDLAGLDIEIIQTALDIPELRSADVQKIALKKVSFAFGWVRKPVLAQDSGFFIDSLKGFPGAYVNYVLNTIGIEGILALVNNKSRGCEFRECLAYLDESLPEPIFFTSRIRGIISIEPRGEIQKHHWSPLSLIFVPGGEVNTLAEMSYEEYVEWNKLVRTDSASKSFARWLAEKN